MNTNLFRILGSLDHQSIWIKFITAEILLRVTVCAFIDLQYIDKEGTMQSKNLLLILLTLLI